MRKKILVTTIAILAVLALSTVVVSLAWWPPTPKYAVPSRATASLDCLDTGKVWETHGILHMKGSYWTGPAMGAMGPGVVEAWVDFSVNLATGQGTFRGKFEVEMFPGGVFYGSCKGTFVGFLPGTGIFVSYGTYDMYGAGAFEGVTVKQTGVANVTLTYPDGPPYGQWDQEALGVVVFPYWPWP